MVISITLDERGDGRLALGWGRTRNMGWREGLGDKR